jgi:diguanylate cyclase (GGDEF)-like protein/PAS domain S-box-containing protein
MSFFFKQQPFYTLKSYVRHQLSHDWQLGLSLGSAALITVGLVQTDWEPLVSNLLALFMAKPLVMPLLWLGLSGANLLLVKFVAAFIALRRNETRYALMMQGFNVGVWDWDLRSNRFYFSSRWKQIAGYSDDELGDRPQEWFERVHPHDRPALDAAISNYLRGGGTHFEHEYRLLHGDGTYHWMQGRGLAVYGAKGRAQRLVGSQVDITAQKQAEEELWRSTFFDRLTELPSWAGFTNHLEQAIDQAQQDPQARFAILWLDLDQFKLVNHSLGNILGDRLLVAIAQRLKSFLSPHEVIARLGEDEFAILLNQMQTSNDAIRMAEQIQQVLACPFNVDDHEVFVTASIGIALSAPYYLKPEHLLRDAGTAMYRAKALGRASYLVFDKSMRTGMLVKLRLESDLRRAIAQGIAQDIAQGERYQDQKCQVAITDVNAAVNAVPDIQNTVPNVAIDGRLDIIQDSKIDIVKDAEKDIKSNIALNIAPEAIPETVLGMTPETIVMPIPLDAVPEARMTTSEMTPRPPISPLQPTDFQFLDIAQYSSQYLSQYSSQYTDQYSGQYPGQYPGLELYYQPIVQLSTGKVTGFEALVRWQHAEQGLLFPSRFISMAEETGLIIPLSWWILRTACRQMSHWRKLFPDQAALTMSVNLSSKQFSMVDLSSQIQQILRESNLEPHYLKLELTESMVMENATSVIDTLYQLRALGIRLAIDDFGTGYSSLSYLPRFPLTTLKIDRSFVEQIGTCNDSLEIVRTILALAHNLRMDVVAEGVETETQANSLREMGCEYGQGFYFYKPMDVDAATNLLAK